MATEWRYSVKGVQHGPVTAFELRILARGAMLSPRDLVQKGADGKWMLAEKVQGLFEKLVDAPESEPKKATASCDSPCEPAGMSTGTSTPADVVAESSVRIVIDGHAAEKRRPLSAKQRIAINGIVGIAAVLVFAWIGYDAWYEETHFYDRVKKNSEKAAREIDERVSPILKEQQDKLKREAAVEDAQFKSEKEVRDRESERIHIMVQEQHEEYEQKMKELTAQSRKDIEPAFKELDSQIASSEKKVKDAQHIVDTLEEQQRRSKHDRESNDFESSLLGLGPRDQLNAFDKREDTLSAEEQKAYQENRLRDAEEYDKKLEETETRHYKLIEKLREANNRK